MAASIAALSVANLSLLRSGGIDTSNPIAFVLYIILIILLICLAVICLYGIYFCIKTLKELNDDADEEKPVKEINRDDDKIEDTANKILEKLNEKE